LAQLLLVNVGSGDADADFDVVGHFEKFLAGVDAVVIPFDDKLGADYEEVPFDSVSFSEATFEESEGYRDVDLFLGFEHLLGADGGGFVVVAGFLDVGQLFQFEGDFGEDRDVHPAISVNVFFHQLVAYVQAGGIEDNLTGGLFRSRRVELGPTSDSCGVSIDGLQQGFHFEGDAVDAFGIFQIKLDRSGKYTRSQ